MGICKEQLQRNHRSDDSQIIWSISDFFTAHEHSDTAKSFVKISKSPPLEANPMITVPVRYMGKIENVVTF
jgi:hypothetical protein